MESLKNTILIVEDDAGLMELLNERIQEQGYQTTCILSATKALDWLQNNIPTLIVLDYSLPDMNGKELIEELNSKYAVVPPFIIATGRGDERTAVDMMKLGARDYIVKDNHFLELIPLIIKKICAEIEKENKLKITEQALSESNQFNKQIIDCAQEGIVVYDSDMRVIVWNPYMEMLTGEKKSDILGKYSLDVFPFIKNVGLLENIENALNGKKNKDLEFHFTSKVTGNSYWVSDKVSTLRNAENEIFGAISTVRNITEKKQAETDLYTSREEFKYLFDKAPIGYHQIDLEGRILRMNQTELDMLGYTFEELEGKHVWDLNADKDFSIKITKEKLQQQQLNSVPYEREFVRKNGSIVPILVMDRLITSANGEIIGIQSSVQDITEQKAAEYEIARISKYYQSILENSPDGCVLIDSDGNFKYASTSALLMFGYTYDNLLMTHPDEVTHPDDLPMVLANLGRMIQDPTYIPVLEYRFKHNNGNWIWIESTFSNLLEENAINSIIINFRNISDRKLAEETLKLRETYLTAIIENLPGIIWLKDAESHIQLTNTKFAHTFGGEKPEDLLGKTDLDFSPKEHAERYLADDKKVVTTKEPLHVEELIYDQSSIKWFETFKMPIFNENNEVIGTAGYSQDVSERKHAEKALQESEEKFKKAFTTSPDSININRMEDGMYVSINSGFTRIMGYAEEDILGKTSIAINIWVNPSDREKLIQGLRENGIVENLVAQFRAKCGELVYGMMSASIIELNGEKHILSITRNVTERKRIEDALQESEDRYKTITENSINAICIIDEFGKFEWFNNQVLTYSGYTKEQIMGAESFVSFIAPESVEPTVSVFQKMLTGEDYEHQYQLSIINADGERRLCDNYATHFYDRNGKLKLIFIMTDITEQNLAETLLKHERELYLDLVNTQPAGIYRIRVTPEEKWDKDAWSSSKNSPYSMELASDRFCEILGFTRKEFEMNPKILFDLIHPDDQVEYTIRNVEANIKKIPFSWDCRLLINGEIKWVHFESFPRQLANGEIIFTGILYDISDRILAQNALKENSDVLNKVLFASTEFIDSEFESINYKSISENMLEISGARYCSFNMLCENKSDFITVAISGAENSQETIKKILGYDLVGKQWKHDEKKQQRTGGKMITRFESLADLSGSTFSKNILKLVTKMFNLGEIYVVQIKKKDIVLGDFTLLFEGGKTICNKEILELYVSQLGLYIERVNSETALRASEELYRNLVQRIPDGVYKSTNDGKFLEVNPAMIKMLGYESKEELLNIDIKSELYFDVTDRNVKMEKNKNDIKSVFELRKKDGSGIWIEDHGWFNMDMKGNIVSHEGVLRDITERKMAADAIRASEQLLREAQQVAKLGSYAWDMTTGTWTSSDILDGIFGINNAYVRSTDGWLALIHPEWQEMMSDYISNEVIGNHQNFDKEYKIIRQNDGKECWVHGLGQLEYNQLNEPVRLVGTITNIDDRKQAEEALQEKMNELVRFQNVTVGRELVMIELKKEINEMLKKSGQEPKYRIVD